jgi:hypothetical protein
MSQQWKESIVVSITKMAIKLAAVIIEAYVSLISTSHKMLFNILPSRLLPHVEEIIGNH